LVPNTTLWTVRRSFQSLLIIELLASVKESIHCTPGS